jgi:hypothetical protein
MAYPSKYEINKKTILMIKRFNDRVFCTTRAFNLISF